LYLTLLFRESDELRRQSLPVREDGRQMAADQKIELDRRLNAYAVDKIRGRPATAAVRDIRGWVGPMV
jgi:hypothetical protein